LEKLEKIKSISEECASKLGLTVYQISFEGQGKDKVLNIQLDKKGGVTLKEISDFTELVNPLLDEVEELDGPYTLDCSSPGAERFIKMEELPSHIGEYMELSLNDRKILGFLEEVADESVKIKYFIKGKPKKEEIKKADIMKIQLRIKL
jgi:ribosome maturation factor RimP